MLGRNTADLKKKKTCSQTYANPCTQNGFKKPSVKKSNLDVLTCTRCEILRRVRISRSQALILPVHPAIPKMVWGHQDGVKQPSPIRLVQIASRPVFQGASESEEGNCYFSNDSQLIDNNKINNKIK